MKHMLLVYLTHGIFLTWTQKSGYICSSYITIFTRHIMSHPTQPLMSHDSPCFTYLKNQPASFLVVTNTHPPLSLVCQQLPHPLLCSSHPFTPHSSNYIIYIDNISHLSHLRREQSESFGQTTLNSSPSFLFFSFTPGVDDTSDIGSLVSKIRWLCCVNSRASWGKFPLFGKKYFDGSTRGPKRVSLEKIENFLKLSF